MRISLLLLLAGCSLYNEKVFDSTDLAVCMNCEDLSVGDLGDGGVDAARDAAADLEAPDLMPMCVDSGTCPASAPVCGSGGTCGPCSPNGASAVCAAFQGIDKFCFSGACVECLSKDDCAPTNRTCDISSHACAPCKAHSDCTTGACKAGGVCATSTEVAYVNRNIPCSDIRITPSTPTDPYCQVQAATGAGKAFIVVVGSGTAYNPVTLNSTLGAVGPLTIIGPGRSPAPQATIAGSGIGTPDGVSVSTGSGLSATVVLDGLVLTGDGGGTPGAGAKCTVVAGNASLTITNSIIKNSGKVGVDSSGCTVVLDANTIGPTNVGGGILLENGTTYTITNNIIFANGNAGAVVNDKPGVEIDNGASGTFSFNTVAANGDLANDFEGGLVCPTTGGNRMIVNSIIANNSKNPRTTGTQFVNGGKCVFQNVVVGTDSSNAAGLVPSPAAFTSDYHLDVTPGASLTTNQACCIDKITDVTGLMNTDHDVDATHRPKGASWDVGAHEAQ